MFSTSCAWCVLSLLDLGFQLHATVVMSCVLKPASLRLLSDIIESAWGSLTIVVDAYPECVAALQLLSAQAMDSPEFRDTGFHADHVAALQQQIQDLQQDLMAKITRIEQLVLENNELRALRRNRPGKQERKALKAAASTPSDVHEKLPDVLAEGPQEHNIKYAQNLHARNDKKHTPAYTGN